MTELFIMKRNSFTKIVLTMKNKLRKAKPPIRLFLLLYFIILRETRQLTTVINTAFINIPLSCIFIDRHLEKK